MDHPSDRSAPVVVVVMATYNPAAALFDRQIVSLRAQTLSDFVCLVVDDASDETHLAFMRTVLAADARFELVEHTENVGFYRNFERGLLLAAERAPQYVALADQDDHWHPDKLARAVATLSDTGAALTFTDVAMVDPARHLLKPSFYSHRHPTTSGVVDLTLMNSAIGATSVFPLTLLRTALPFPPARHRSFHDHWLARCAQVTGGLAFQPQVSMEYVQHGANVQGATAYRCTLRDFAEVRRTAHSSTDPGLFALERQLVADRLSELLLLRERVPTTPRAVTRGLQRAIALHQRCLQGSRRAIAQLVCSWLVDQHVRLRPRHEHAEINYVRAALVSGARHRKASNGT